MVFGIGWEEREEREGIMWEEGRKYGALGIGYRLHGWDGLEESLLGLGLGLGLGISLFISQS